MSDTVTTSGPTVKALDPAFDEDAAIIIAACTVEGTVERGRAVVHEARSDPKSELFGLFVDGRLVGAYVLRKATMMNEIPFLAIAPEHRRQGHGRMCLFDALLRSGKRPLVVETDDEALPFYKAVGFKMVGKRKGPDGSPRYRLGWHAPIPKPGGAPGEVVC
jgi:ribosomal protein S18 acetylase RimI-like enzyme